MLSNILARACRISVAALRLRSIASNFPACIFSGPPEKAGACPEGLIDAGPAEAKAIHDILHGAGIVALFPEQPDGLVQDLVSIEFFRASHDQIPLQVFAVKVFNKSDIIACLRIRPH